ncbi:MAG: ankyrin repeat domain-containing protein [Spirulinaceae cyanobacterium]
MTGTYKEYSYLINLLAESNIELLEDVEKVIDSFPKGVDDFIHRQWITNAIDCGSLESVKWVLSKDVDLSFRDDEGYTPILSAIERDLPDKYEIIQLLIDCGAPINKKGINDWTPLHMAAAREDLEALRILVKNAAALTIRTEIDDYATPLEEAIILKKQKSAEYLQSMDTILFHARLVEHQIIIEEDNFEESAIT